MSDSFKVETTDGLKAVGPFQVNRLTIDGYSIPFLTGSLHDGIWSFTLDGRFACDVPEMYGQGVAWIIANAIAVGAGYSCFGKNSIPLNRFNRRLSCLDMVPEIDSMDAEEGEQ